MAGKKSWLQSLRFWQGFAVLCLLLAAFLVVAYSNDWLAPKPVTYVQSNGGQNGLAPAPPQTPQNAVADTTNEQEWRNCSRTDSFDFQNLNVPISLQAYKDSSGNLVCQKATYSAGSKRVLITYYGNEHNSITNRDEALLDYKCYINGSLYNHQRIGLALGDIGLVIEALKMDGYLTSAPSVSRLLAVLPKIYWPGNPCV